MEERTNAPEALEGVEHPAMTELELENQRLREENARLKAYRDSLPPKERLYDHVNLSVKQMDRIIGGLLVLLAVVFIMGLVNR